MADGPWTQYQGASSAPADGPWVQYQKPTETAPAPAPSISDDLKRSAGLTARYALEGVGALPGVAGDAMAHLMNAAGMNVGMPSKTIQTGIDALGLPKPEGGMENVSADVSRALAGAGTGGAIAKLGVAAADSPIVKSIMDMLSQRMGMQAAGAAGSGAAGGVAREAGAGPTGQEVAGLVGGFAGPAALAAGGQAAGAIARGARAAVQPFTKGGQEQVVANTLNKFAQNPNTARANLADVPEYVEGSQPTTAQAAHDVGLAQLERTLANNSPDFAARAQENNVARVRELASKAKTPEDLNAALEARGTQAAEDYGKAANTPLGDVDIAPFAALLQKPAFQQATKVAQRLAQNDGLDISDVNQLFDTPKGLHYIKLALDDQIGTAAQQGLGAAERRAIVGVKNDYLDWLDKASPSYQTARQNFAEASGPINRMETLQDIQKRTQTAAPDVEGNPVLSQAKWKNVVTNNLDELGKKLSPDEIASLKSIGDDLDRGTISSAGKSVGSNTVQNITSANVLGAALGDKWGSSTVARTLAKPLNWLYGHVAENDVKDLLNKAMLDPTAARLLMSKATPKNVEALSDVLLGRYKAMIAGATTGTVGQTGLQ